LETSASPAGLTARARPEARPEKRAANLCERTKIEPVLLHALQDHMVVVKAGTGRIFSGRYTEGTRSMSVTLINIFEVPADDEDAFIAAWEKSRDYLMKLPAHIETALHQSLHDEQFRFVNIAHWTSEEEFNDAVRSQGFRETAADLRWPMHPALYQVVRTG
jgi:heme-degrading monooxygenase HmoA